MLWSGSSPLTVMRDSMWGFLLFAGAAWLAIAWSVLRLEPTDVVSVAGPVLLFGALCEAVRGLAGTRTWWLNASMAVLFAATGALLLADRDSALATPESLIAWYLMVRGALDVAVSIMNRGSDRTWGLIMTLGVVQAGLGFVAAGPWWRTADLVVVTLGALGMLRAIADLATSLRLREASHVRHEVLRLSPEREAGVAGYSAGLSAYPGASSAGRPRHRAIPAGTVVVAGGPPAGGGSPSFHEEVVRTTADLDTMIARAGVTGTGAASGRVPADLPPMPDTPEGAAEGAAEIGATAKSAAGKGVAGKGTAAKGTAGKTAGNGTAGKTAGRGMAGENEAAASQEEAAATSEDTRSY